MSDSTPRRFAERLEQAGEEDPAARYVLRLYVTGMTPRSTRAIENVRKICEEYLEGRYQLEVVDVYQQPEQTRIDQVVAAPTLIKRLPLPLRRIIGDMSSRERLLRGLDIERI